MIKLKKITFAVLFSWIVISCGGKKVNNKSLDKGQAKSKVTFMTIDPGHFHAALVHKTMYSQVDSTIYIFAPEGAEVKEFLNKIDQYNARPNNSTDWHVETSYGNDFINQMIDQKPGNVMIVAGKNSKKIDYILKAVKAGINVYADKPLVINSQGFKKLKEAFKIANENNVVIYDIMTERFEATTVMQKLFSTMPNVFGELVDGTEEEPAISKESVHHFFKYVSGKPLVRPSWFFDVSEEGEGIVDVTTHLVDLVQWEAFPNQIIDSTDIEFVSAKRWPTVLTKNEFAKVTGLEEYPKYLEKDIVKSELNVFCNGEINYKIKEKHAKVSVIWNFQAPEGTGDTHYSIMRGTKSNLIIKQGSEEGFKPVLYIKPNTENPFENILKSAIDMEIKEQFPGTTAEKMSNGLWKINIPDKFKIGHEAHFAQVTQNYLNYLEAKELPAWEIPNIITKYYTTTAAFKMAQEE